MESLISFCFVFIDLLVLYDLILLVEIPFGIPMKSNFKQLAVLGILFVLYYWIVRYFVQPPLGVGALFEYAFYAAAIVICASAKRFKALLLSIPAVLVYAQWTTNIELLEALFGWNKYVFEVDGVEITPLYFVAEITFFILLVMLKRITAQKPINVTLSVPEGICIVLFCIFGSYSVGIFEMLNETFHDRALNIAWVLFVWLISGAIVYAIAYRKRAKYYQHLSSHYKEQFDSEYAYFKEYKMSNKEISKFRHDWKNHMLVMQGLLEQGRTDEAKAYFGSLSEREMSNSHKILTGNEIVDMILAAKMCDMEEKEINFSYEGNLQGIAHIKPADICIIFSNLLDNAIEAAQMCEKEKTITLEAKDSTNHCLILMQNSMQGKAVWSEDGLVSTKTDGEHHGIGLHNVREAVAFYGGELLIETEEGCFAIKVILPK